MHGHQTHSSLMDLTLTSRVKWLTVNTCSQERTDFVINIYRVCINYRRISLRHNLRRKCRKIVKFVSITHSERNIWNGPIVATAIGNVTEDMLEGVWQEWEYRLDICCVTRKVHIACI